MTEEVANPEMRSALKVFFGGVKDIGDEIRKTEELVKKSDEEDAKRKLLEVNKNEDNEKSDGVDRSKRRFLQAMVTIPVGAYVLSKLGRFFPSEAQENLKGQERELVEGDLELREILEDPSGFFQNTINSIERSGIKSEEHNAFLEAFSENHSENPDSARANVESIVHAYRDLGLGGKFYSVLEKAGAISALPGQSEKDQFTNYGFHQTLRSAEDLYKPFLKIQSAISEGKSIEMEDYNKLIKLADWMRPLSESDSYDDQRMLYRNRAEKEVANGFSVIENALAEWEHAYGPENKKILSDILHSCYEHIPTALLNIDSIKFSGSRAFAHVEDHENIHIKLNGKLQEAINAMSSGDKTTAREHMDSFLTTLVHEMAHPVDPDLNMDQMDWATHPEDFINYLDAYVNAIGDHRNRVLGVDGKGLQAEALEMLDLDPANRVVIGVEGVSDVASFSNLKAQLEDLKKVAEFAQTVEGRAAVKAAGLEHFFTEGGNEMLVWRLRSEEFSSQERSDFALRYARLRNVSENPRQSLSLDQDKKLISNFDVIDPKHIQELMNLSETLFSKINAENSNEGQVDHAVVGELLKEICEIKSVYYLASYKLLESLKSQGKEPLYLEHVYISTEVYKAWMHRLTGPINQYLGSPNKKFSLSIPQEEQLSSHLNDLNQRRQRIKNTLNAKGTATDTSVAQSALNVQMQYVVDIAGKRARLWGGQGNADYTQIANESMQSSGI